MGLSELFSIFHFRKPESRIHKINRLKTNQTITISLYHSANYKIASSWHESWNMEK
jgi:hypothetical protein